MESSAKVHCRDKLKTCTIFWDFKLLPRCIWGLRPFGKFICLGWWSVVDISGQYLSHLQRSNNCRRIAWLVEDGTSMWSRNVGNWLPTYATQIPWDDLILFESRNFLLDVNSVGTKHELVTDLLHCFYFAFVILASKAEHFHGFTVSLTDVLCLVWPCPVFMIDCRLRNGCNLLYCQSLQTVLYILSHCPWLKPNIPCSVGPVL